MHNGHLIYPARTPEKRGGVTGAVFAGQAARFGRIRDRAPRLVSRPGGPRREQLCWDFFSPEDGTLDRKDTDSGVQESRAVINDPRKFPAIGYSQELGPGGLTEGGGWVGVGKGNRSL